MSSPGMIIRMSSWSASGRFDGALLRVIRFTLLVSGSSSAVERQLPKLDVAGSIPVSRSILQFPGGQSGLVLGLGFQPPRGHLCIRHCGQIGEYSWLCCRFDPGPFDLELEAQTRCFKSNKMISQTKRRYLTSIS